MVESPASVIIFDFNIIARGLAVHAFQIELRQNI
jgi:hypothetical protein